uniref:T-cell differentiation antigen CD6 n=1 Tax=Lepisosteus oculatus TaxID=7918 RepID=W5MNV3_LEPOC|nr:PREDICTED: T-cell differentiation antigen CD6-like [Lepisosteus oculatus]
MELLKLTLIIQAVVLSQAFQNNSYYPQNNTSEATANHTDTANETEHLISIFKLSKTCSGTLEVLHNGTWIPVILTPGSSNEPANRICKKLGCGKYFHRDDNSSQYTDGENREVQNTSYQMECIFESLDVLKCKHVWERNFTNVTEIFCGHQAVRLAGGSERCAGRVEVWEAGQWGTVCDDEWDIQDGHVVCAQLGCGFAVEVTHNATPFGKGLGPVLLDDVNCTGTEPNLWRCPSQKLSGDCGHKEDAGVVCSEHKAVRLTGGLDRCSGRVEIHRNGSWGTVCDNGWDKQESGMVCALLGCGPPQEYIIHPPFTHESALKFFYYCKKKHIELWDCTELINHVYACTDSNAAGLICQGSLGFPNITTPAPTNNYTTGPVTTASNEVESTGFVLSFPLLGCFLLLFLLILALIVIALLFGRYRKKEVMPVQLNSTGRHITSERQDNDYDESVDLIKVTANNPDGHVNPELQTAPSNDDTSSFDSDYEHYDFSAEPAAAMSTFQNSLRNRTENRSPMFNSIPLCSLAEEETPNTLQVPTCTNPNINEDTSSTSSGESNFYNNSEKQKTLSLPVAEDSFDSSSTSSGECYENTDQNADQLPAPDIAGPLWSEDTSTLLEPCSYLTPGDCLMTPVTNDPEYYSCPPPGPTASADPGDSADSSSTSSGECYENTAINNDQALPVMIHDSGESSTDDDYDDIANYHT